MPRLMPLALVLAITACSGSRSAEQRADSLSQRQRDSLVGNLPVPGARSGIQGALRATDSAEARRQREAQIVADSE